MSKKNITIDAVAAAILEHFIDTGDGATADQLAERLGCSVATVRARCNEAHGCPRGTYAEQESRQSFSRNYRSMEAGAHQVMVYRPLPSTLREVILGLRAAVGRGG